MYEGLDLERFFTAYTSISKPYYHLYSITKVFLYVEMKYALVTYVIAKYYKTLKTYFNWARKIVIFTS